MSGRNLSIDRADYNQMSNLAPEGTTKTFKHISSRKHDSQTYSSITVSGIRADEIQNHDDIVAPHILGTTEVNGTPQQTPPIGELDFVPRVRRPSSITKKRQVSISCGKRRASRARSSITPTSIEGKVVTYPTNYIQTTKYTALSFIPKSIIVQFKRLANVYFLVIAILQSIPIISPLHPITGWFPLAFVLFVSMCREGYEDYIRRVYDKKSNSQGVLINPRSPHVYEKGSKTSSVSRIKQVQVVPVGNDNHRLSASEESTWEEIRSQDLKVGSICLIEENEELPADIVLMGTSNEDLTAYLETSNLDGEKTLKKKIVIDNILNEKCQKSNFSFQGNMTCMPPTKPLSNFSGILESSIIERKEWGLDEKQLLLKGSRLKNTSWIVGCVAYTGVHTKIMLNSHTSRFKRSKVEELMNQLILMVLVLQIAICIIIASISAWFHDQRVVPKHTYVQYQQSGLATWFIKFFAYFLLLNTFIPISLVVTLEIVKFFQMFLIQWDIYILAVVHTCSINEELGQVKYIFSDKTGTLTSNSMELKLLLIVGTVYGDESLINSGISSPNDADSPIIRPTTKYTFYDKEIKRTLSKRFNSFKPRRSVKSSNLPHMNIATERQGEDYDIEQTSYLYRVWPSLVLSTDRQSLNEEPIHPYSGYELNLHTEAGRIKEFMKLLSCCHECTSVFDPKTSEVDYYQGTSPDEIALLESSRNIGFQYENIKEGEITIIEKIEEVEKEMSRDMGSFQPKCIRIKVLDSMEFTSERKRMSVLVKDHMDGDRYKLYIKGADSVIFQRLHQVQPSNSILHIATDFLHKTSLLGYRTLVMAIRIFTPQECTQIDLQLEQIKLKFEVRDYNRTKLFDYLEKDLIYLGCSAVEDKLQDKVPETIADLQTAGICIWMLTGDKLETADNIAKSCKLITPQMIKYTLDYEQPLKLEKFLEERKREKKSGQIPPSEVLVITSGALKSILLVDKLKKRFITFAMRCTSIICCRASPGEKAEVVKAIKERCKQEITLAIGDGANDVSMIMEAHIGVGIFGKEGMRAAQTADYAIGEFKSLWHLLLIQGRLSYLRIGEMILYFFYKNVVFTIPQLFFAFYSAYSGQTFYDDWFISFYNMFFTMAPLTFKALIDHDIHHIKDNYQSQLHSLYPYIYSTGQFNWLFTKANFVKWWALGFLHSALLYFIPIYCFRDAILFQNGKSGDIWSLSATSFTAVVFVVTNKIFQSERYLTSINNFGYAICTLLAYLSYFVISNYLPYTKTYRTIETLLQTPHFYLVTLLCFSICFIGDYFIRVYTFYCQQSTSQYCREWMWETKNKYKSTTLSISDPKFAQFWDNKMDKLKEKAGREMEIGNREFLMARTQGKKKIK